MSGPVGSDAVDNKKDQGQPLQSEDTEAADQTTQSPDHMAEPLPSLESDSADEAAGEDEDSPAAAIKSSQADPPDLNYLLGSQRGEETSGSSQAARDKDQPAADAGPRYRVSPASANFDSYTMSPLEEDDGPEADDKDSGWQTAWAVVREVGETILLTLIIFLLIQMVVRNFRVVGTSMVDNLHDGQYLIIDKLSYNPLIYENLGVGGPQRGDVVVFEPPRRPDEDYVKRIIGLAGEKVQVIKGQVFVNDEPLDEPFLPRTGSYTMPNPVTVPEGQVFVLGDNRNNSNDSHNWGPLPVDNIVGRAWLSYWPPDLWGTIPRDAPTDEATLKQLVGDLIPSASAQSE